MCVDTVIKQLHTDFTLTTEELHTISQLFLDDMNAGLNGRPSSLAMLPSFLTKPDGKETGLFLALDFGGTNVRALLVELTGDGQYIIQSRQNAPLVNPTANYNHIANNSTAEELFDFLALLLAGLTKQDQTYLLGYTFSFPCRQISKDSAVLLYWTKEIATKGVVGHNVADLLNQAFIRNNIRNVSCVAILNDTVSALMAAAYENSLTDIGSICGTGHNTCYLEPTPPWDTRPMYVNMESGHFNKVQSNRYDRILDNNSEQPGIGRLEKMCSGRYIGELLRLVIIDLAGKGVLFDSTCHDNSTNCNNNHIHLPVNALDGKDIARILADSTPMLDNITTWTAELGLPGKVSLSGRSLLKTAAALISTRSARLAAATYAATLKHIDPAMERQHVIAIDGSLYEKIPGYADTIQATLDELLGDKAHLAECKLKKDGSGIGAAVAAATSLLD